MIYSERAFFHGDHCQHVADRDEAARLARANRHVRHNPHTGQRYTVVPSSIPYAADESDCDQCDGYGRIWNNADPTSGQFVQCDCGDTRGQP